MIGVDFKANLNELSDVVYAYIKRSAYTRNYNYSVVVLFHYENEDHLT